MNAPVPLRDALRDPFSEGDLARLWPAIEARRARGRRLFAGASVLVMAGAAAATAFALAVPPRASASRLGPLHLATGAAVRPLDGAAGAPVVTFDDRSRLGGRRSRPPPPPAGAHSPP